MKRAFNFLLFVALLAIAVGSLQFWKERRYRGGNLSLSELLPRFFPA